MKEKKSNTKLIECPICNKTSHNWKNVYLDQGTFLKAENHLLITFCSQKKEYILIDTKQQLQSGNTNKIYL